MSMASEKQMHLAGTAGDVAGGQLPAGIAGEKEKTNQGGWFYFTLLGNLKEKENLSRLWRSYQKLLKENAGMYHIKYLAS